MKVNSFRDIFRFNSPLKAQAEGEGHGNAPGYEQNPSRNGQGQTEDSRSESQPPQAVLSPEQELNAIRAAIEDFQKESQTQQHGLHASLAEKKPGLTVVLSDVNGNVIRSFSSGEFLKLRSNGRQDSRGRGKLLDQKF